MDLSKPFLISLLFCFLLLIRQDTFAQRSHCKEIEVKVVIEDQGLTTMLRVSLDVDQNAVVVNLIGSKGKHTLDSKSLEFAGLEKGEYVLVVNGRKEQDDFCVTHKNITID